MVEIKNNEKHNINIIIALVLNLSAITCLGWAIGQLISTLLNRVGSQLVLNDWLLLTLSIMPILALILGYLIGFRSSNNKLTSLILAGLLSLTMFAITLAFDIGNSIFMLFTNLTTWVVVYAITSFALIIAAFWYSKKLASKNS